MKEEKARARAGDGVAVRENGGRAIERGGRERASHGRRRRLAGLGEG